LRVFQAVVSAATRRSGGALTESARAALEWLESQSRAPMVIAPAFSSGSGYRLSVPNNAMDVVARAWSRGNDSNSGDANPATHRTMKAVRPTVLPDGDAVHYIWEMSEPVREEVRGHAMALSQAAGSIIALGWGLDLVVGHAALISDAQLRSLAGERWVPDAPGETILRQPIAGTLEDVMRRHEQFLNRVGEHGFVPPSPLSAFARTEYRRATTSGPRAIAAFSLLRPEADGFRMFDAVRRGLTVAGMFRGAVKAAAEQSGWPEAKIAAFVLGHGESNGNGHVTVGQQRFAYLPLPSIENRSGGRATSSGIRRVLLTVFSSGCEQEIAWAQRVVSGQELRDEHTKQRVALLSVIPSSEKVVRRYTGKASSWATVTPVVLPGYDDPRHYRRRLEGRLKAEEQRRLIVQLQGRIDALLRKAIVQAGFSEELANAAELDWAKTGFWLGTEHADRYGVPDHLKRFPRYHVRLWWTGKEVSGPVCIGGGRFYGLGLFASEQTCAPLI
jgi:CRISPR-associated protein Csb2